MKNLQQYIYIFLFSFIFLQQGLSNSGEIFFNLEFQYPTCIESTDGIITINDATGDAPHVYSFDGGTTFSTNNTLEDLPIGTYEIVVEDVNGCQGSKILELDRNNYLLVDLGADMVIKLGEVIELSPLISGTFNSITYYSSDTLIPNGFNFAQLILAPVNSLTITVRVRDLYGCFTYDEIFIEVIKEEDVFIPNAFTPNDDGYNDRFTVFAGPSVLQIKNFYVFNSWGGIVYEAHNISPNEPFLGWDGRLHGKAMNPGVFLYQVEVEYLDRVAKKFYGDVLLYR